MIGTPGQDVFVNKYKWAVVRTLRCDGSPSSAVSFFAREGNDLLSRALTEEDGLVEKHVAINRAMRRLPDWNPPGQLRGAPARRGPRVRPGEGVVGFRRRRAVRR